MKSKGMEGGDGKMVKSVLVYNTTKRDLRARVEYVSETEEKFISSGEFRLFTKEDIVEGEKIKVFILEDKEE